MPRRKDQMMFKKAELRKIFRKKISFLKKLFRVAGDGEVFLLYNYPPRDDLMFLTFFIAKMYLYVERHSETPSISDDELRIFSTIWPNADEYLMKYMDASERFIVYTLRGYSLNPLPEKVNEVMEFLEKDLELIVG
ncbi:MAG: hypothetical protein NZ941_01215 [Candidatus Caldarchaeum sp.]|nr:hypothetical protein [Candidatus Caldarchaeum sp.]